MSLQDIQFQEADSDAVHLKKLRQFVEEVIRLSRQRGGTTSGGGGSIGTSAAQVVVVSASTTFPNGLVLQANGGLALTHDAANVTISLASVALNKIEPIPQNNLLGRYDAGTGDVQNIAIGTGLQIVGGVLQTSTANAGYPRALGHARIF